MASERNTWIDAVAKMIKLTNSGKLRWEANNEVNLATEPPVLYATYKNHRLRLYKSLMRSIPTLELMGEDDTTLWTFPQTEALVDLFKAAKFQLAGVKDFLAGILSED